jgi:hypothetical protein
VICVNAVNDASLVCSRGNTADQNGLRDDSSVIYQVTEDAHQTEYDVMARALLDEGQGGPSKSDKAGGTVAPRPCGGFAVPVT